MPALIQIAKPSLFELDRKNRDAPVRFGDNLIEHCTIRQPPPLLEVFGWLSFNVPPAGPGRRWPRIHGSAKFGNDRLDTFVGIGGESTRQNRRVLIKARASSRESTRPLSLKRKLSSAADFFLRMILRKPGQSIRDDVSVRLAGLRNRGVTRTPTKPRKSQEAHNHDL